MNSVIFNNALRFIVLLMLQVLLLNNINFLGYINPYLYVVFILLYPFNANQTLFIFLSFLLGWGIDIFEDSGGINAAACVVAAYIRPAVLRFSFGVSYDYQTIKFSSTQPGSRISYVLIIVLVHHLVLFLLEFFNFAHLLLLLKKTFFSAAFTIILVFITLALFNKRSR
ncbi:rod shape-determining protein MreD [Salinimicrobium profundisediminis]|uniref:Rod shape-determining protein MreD n=1 Tax=Salinimicrobium profundisediminis TaxID=2994553 RepID=A0A9X3I149_9FLAO|nr:rod shape-determining protein MreD [Salinimicrobium profundisediminis]MCX2838088.1 rod shape-determining protein MreD [Salinimicrobium profundisediminis]